MVEPESAPHKYMPEDKNSTTVDFLNNIDSVEPFKEEPVEEEKEPIETEVDEKPLPFHKDPKIQRYIEKEVDKKLKDFKPAERQFREDVEDIKLPSSFIKLVGNNTPEKVEVLKDLEKYFGTLKGEARQEFLQEMQQQQKQQVEEDKRAEEELENYFEQIEESYNVDLSSNSATAKKQRSDFIDYVRKIAPKNEEGEVVAYPDLVSAFEEFQDKGKRAPASRAKELASRGMTRSTDASAGAPKYQVGKGDPWRQVEQHINRLKEN